MEQMELQEKEDWVAVLEIMALIITFCSGQKDIFIKMNIYQEELHQQ